MGKFNFESLKKAAELFVAEQENQQEGAEVGAYGHLKALDENGVAFKTEYVRVICPQAEYKVLGHYTSRLDVEDKERDVTYSSTLAIDPKDGVMISKSQNWQNIPSEHMQRVEQYLNGTVLTAADVKQKIVNDARLKVKAKVRRTKDPIEDNDIGKIEILEHKIKKTTYAVVEWTEVRRLCDNALIATGFGYEGGSAVYEFVPVTSQVPVEKRDSKEKIAVSKVSAKPEESAKSKPVTEKKRSKIKASDVSGLVGRCIGKIFSAATVALLLLVVEAIVLVATNLFGVRAIYKAPAGIYTVNTDNYQKYLMIRLPSGNTYVKVEEGEKQTYVPRQSSSDMSNYGLFQIVPANTSFSLFDINQKKSVEHYGDYKPWKWLSPTVQKYELNDLCIRYQVTYCYQGKEHTVENTMYFSSFDQLKDAYLTVDFPQETMQSEDREYVSNMKGDTYTQTSYWAAVEYWYVTVLEVSGTAEVKEVK
jgi:hypothetical protein